jgi:hypothetical protein
VHRPSERSLDIGQIGAGLLDTASWLASWPWPRRPAGLVGLSLEQLGVDAGDDLALLHDRVEVDVQVLDVARPQEPANTVMTALRAPVAEMAATTDPFVTGAVRKAVRFPRLWL